jgi:hypothetical protein
MTLCIAAACCHDGQSAVVTCADWQITGPIIAAEDYYKLRHYHNTTIMISGELGAIDDFCFDLHAVIKELNEIPKPNGDLEPRINEYLARIREAAQRRKRLRTEHHVAMKYGISLDRFYKKGAKMMPKGIYKEVINEIRGIKLDISTIIIYSGDRELLMLKTGPWGGAFWERNYAAIGSGERIALSMLCQAPHNRDLPLVECLMRVVAAKAAAERDPYVGRNTSLGIILGDGSRYDISDEGWAWLMDKVRAPIFPAIGGEYASLSVLGRRLGEGECGQGRQTVDPWGQIRTERQAP